MSYFLSCYFVKFFCVRYFGVVCSVVCSLMRCFLPYCYLVCYVLASLYLSFVRFSGLFFTVVRSDMWVYSAVLRAVFCIMLWDDNCVIRYKFVHFL